MRLLLNLINGTISNKKCFKKIVKTYVQSQWSVVQSLVKVSQILAEFHPERAAYKTLHN